MPHEPLPIVADAIVPPDQWFDGADPKGIFGGRVLKTSAGLEVFERTDRVVKLLPANWRQLAEQQGQQIQPHEPHASAILRVDVPDPT